MTDPATGLVQFSSLGQATFANNQLTFGDGSVWAKGVSLNPTTGGTNTQNTSGKFVYDFVFIPGILLFNSRVK